MPGVAGTSGLRAKLVNTGEKVLNLASHIFTGRSGNEAIKVRVIETLLIHAVGSCGFPVQIGASVGSQSVIVVMRGVAQMSTWTLSAK